MGKSRGDEAGDWGRRGGTDVGCGGEHCMSGEGVTDAQTRSVLTRGPGIQRPTPSAMGANNEWGARSRFVCTFGDCGMASAVILTPAEGAWLPGREFKIFKRGP